MPEIITAKTAGFCFGVKKAVDQAFALAEEKNDSAICTYGPIIHNDEVVRRLEERGVTTLHSEEDLNKVTEGTVILRSHGVPKRIVDDLEERGIDYVDVTCPFVKRIHNIVYEKSEDHNIVIVGNPAHPEVEGIMGWCRRKADVLQTAQEAEDYQPPEALPVCVVAQTTFNLKKFQEILAIFEKKRYDVNIVNTICNATAQHQSEAREIAETADAMIVIGDTKSSNSRKLYEICREVCESTFFIQTVEDLQFPEGAKYQRIGITAGASTPNYIIEEVQKYVGRIF